MASIPFDVVMEILPLIDASDLPAMARTNRYLSDFALNQMYGHISSRNLRAACQSIHWNPNLAQRVRSLEVNRNDHGAHLDSVLPAVRDALRVSLNLRTLKLDVDGKHSWVLKSALGAFKLRSFSCAAYADQDLLDFLHDQTELEEIALSHSYSLIERGPSMPWDFPLLKKFNGPMSWIDLIVRHQPVSHVVISYIRLGSPITSLGLTTTPIRHLQIPIHALEQKQPEELRALFPSLEELVLTMPHVWVTRPMSSIPVSHSLRDILEALSTVQDFRILRYDPNAEAEHDDTHFVKTATEKAPAVRRFSVQYNKRIEGRMWDSTISWTRGVNGWERLELLH